METEARKAYKRAYYRAWRKRNPGKETEYQMRWRSGHREEYRRYQRDYEWALAKNNHMRIGRILRCRITAVLKRKPRASTLTGLLGCSVRFFKAYIETLWLPGMSWENHGLVWHIDHRKPCCRFDLSNPVEQMKCFNWKNQKPMWASANMSKGGRRVE